MKRTRPCSALAIAASAVVLAACGSGTEVEEGTGPIRIVTIASFESQQFSVPQVRTAVEVAVAEVNARGGVDGRPLEATFCNDRFDPNEALACARRAVEDGAVAAVGGATPHSASILPVLEAAEIPLVAGSASSGAIELTSPVSYPITAGSAGMSVGTGRVAVEFGGPKVAVMANETEGAVQSARLTTRGVEAAGGTATTTSVPLGAPDTSASVAAALRDDPDAVVLQVVTEDATKIVTSLRQSGYTGTIVGPASLFPASSIAALGDQAEGIQVTGRTAPVSSTDIPEVARFRTEMTAAQPDVRLDDLGLNAWSGVRMLAAALQGHTVTDGASVIAALNAIITPIPLGTVPDYAGIATPPPVADYPRVSNFFTVRSRVQNGDLHQDGGFFDPLASAG